MLKKGKCILCGSEAKVEEYLKDGDPPHDCQCEFCGNYYLCPRTVIKVINDKELYCKLGALIKELRLKGMSELLTITDKVTGDDGSVAIDDLVSQYPRSASEMIERTLLNISRYISHPFSECNIDRQEMPLVTFTRNFDEAFKMVQTLVSMDYVTYKPPEGIGTDGIPSGKVAYGITPNGWKRVDELRKTNLNSNKAFMAMKFGDEEMDCIFLNTFKPAVKQTGFELFKLDEKPVAGLIDDRMRVEIRTSRFLVADLTHGNLGAYWEAGFAEGLGKHVIYTCKKSVFEDENTRPHFDINHHLTIVWDPDDLQVAADNLKATIRATFPGEAMMSDEQ
jgi:hypothetical protein